MSLRMKVALILLNVCALYCVAVVVVERTISQPSFAELEREEAKKDLERCVQAIDRELHHLDLLCFDWSAWDDTYRFVQDGDQGYVDTNLVASTFTLNDLSLLYVFDLTGRLVWGKAIDLETEEAIALEALPMGHRSADHPFLHHEEPGSSITGVQMTERGPMLLSSRPIVTSEREGPIRGTLLMGRFLTDRLVTTLAQQTRVDMTALPLTGQSAVWSARQPSDGVTRDAIPVLVSEERDGYLRVSTTYPNTDAEPVLLVQADVPRDIMARGRSAMRSAVFSLAIAGASALLVMLLVSQRTVVAPIVALTRHATRIGQSGDLDARLSADRDDEIGALANEFNQMLEHLSEARRRLLEESYRSGKADMIAGALHNVRNALGPVMVDVDELRARLSEMHMDRIEAALAELAGSNGPPKRRRELLAYVQLATKRLVHLAQDMPEHLARISQQVAWIQQMLTQEEEASRGTPVLESLQLDEMVRDAVELARDRCRATLHVASDPSLARIGPVRAARMGLLQVMGNLLTNAAEAKPTDRDDGVQVDISAGVERDNGTDLAHIRVRDDGCGIDPALLDRVFERGFSTKARSWGLGLHWSANAVAAMGGRIYVESEGADRGTCVHVLLPKAN